MVDTSAAGFPALKNPPIVEVVCGVVYEPLAELDALVLGVYWDERKKDYPQKQLHPALADDASFSFGFFPMRAVLLSEDNQFLLQIQHDRFFMNWRATGSVYPRFSERHGPNGLLSRMETELSYFSRFVDLRCSAPLVVKRVELTKIDVLERGRHWSDMQDLAELVPLTGAFAEIQRTDSRDVNLRFLERGPDGTSVVHISTIADGNAPGAIRVEMRFVTEAVPSVQDAFVRGNGVLNEAFFKLVPDAKQRFGLEGGSA